ncbi:uncharacterized protein DUF3238 [Paenibacillus cellulosilyticus]|uniref:Uncharacterized protein DUF3238 n=1 Tax=Paenibacillus cellulosilyticus TaxID=375489 RepID=A0A2V2Z1N1_9BACL|nr:DUF3238 domain-containing protein [Paenibacillus cellulosilyticus]PWW08752.1 uncharacterized protein DUF3238 [Paenibacillus cellulosilyticus]QKS48311.1 DUF3238 domain-containing protein [Paenibacillus cellulosilyticus]
MADIIKIRGSVFIGGILYLPPTQDPSTGTIYEFQGDAREFTPYAVNTGRCRVEQEVVIDFVKRRVTTFANTGVTILRLTASDGSVEYKYGKASIEGIRVEDEMWAEDTVALTMRASASNPLIADSPTVDYLLQVVAHRNGSVQMKGSHDGFPCFEFYKQVDFGHFELLHAHDYRKTGDTPAAMAGDMEYHFEV